MSATSEPRRITPLIWAGLGVLLAAADLTALAALLPQITVDLNVPLPGGLSDVAWVVSAYLIGNIVALPITGRLADRVPRRLVYVAALLIFVVGSVGSALAPTVWLLVAARAVQAVGAGALVPITMALATDVLPRARWALAFGVISAVDTAGWALGPLYGAAFVRWLDWRWLFWINVPLGLLAAAGGWWGLRHLPTARSGRRIDWLGAALLTAALTALNIGLSKLGGGATGGISFEVQQPGIDWAAALPWLAGGLLALGLFVASQVRRPTPLINLTWLRQPAVAAAGLINLLFGALLIVATVNVPLFTNAAADRGGAVAATLQDAALRSGLALMAMTGLMALCAPLGGALAARVGARAVVLAGAALSAAGFALLRTWQISTTLPVMAAELALLGVGFGLLLAPPAAAVVGAAPADERGVAASLVLLLRLSGMSLGLSALTAWSLAAFDARSAALTFQELTAERVQGITVAVLHTTFGAAAVAALVIAALALVQPRTSTPPENV